MPDSHKSIIVLASVLKPVDDSRLYEKIGLSLASSGKYQVHIIGTDAMKTENPDIVQHGLKPFGRISLGRFLAPWRILFKTLRLKPDIFIFATHELLYLAMFLKLVTKSRVIYDVQENYYWNILYTPAFPLLIKPFLALYVRGKELVSARFVDHFFLAEKGYQQEMKFPGKKCTVLENKVRMTDSDTKTKASLNDRSTINLIFSGTIAETTGVFTAIDLAVKLHVLDDRIRLTLAGYCAQPRALERIRLLIKPRPFIRLITADAPLPHTEILKHIRNADFGLVTYQINPSTTNSIPTKLYEYLGFQLPILLVNHRPWVDFCLPYSAAVVFNDHAYDAAEVYRKMLQTTFYTARPEQVYWGDEEPRLLAAVGRL